MSTFARKDLSIKHQFLDVVIVRKPKGRLTRPLPDGLDSLADHNLITFKSHQETLDDWALKELTGHYVNYRKQVAAADQPLLPEEAFRLYAICSRFPHNLAQTVPWEPLHEGVYQCRRGTDAIRVIVAGQLPQQENNATLHLLSASAQVWRYGADHYHPRSPNASSLILDLLKGFQSEGISMPYTMEDYRTEVTMEHFKDLTPAQRAEAMKNLTPAERVAAMKDVTAELVLKALSPEELKRLREQLGTGGTSAQPKKRRRK